MPHPVFIICCDSMVEDKTTNRASLLNVIEKVITRKHRMEMTPDGGLVMPTAPPQGFALHFECSVLAVWMADPGDVGLEFRHQFITTAPNGAIDPITEPIPFRFVEKRAWRRFRLNMIGTLPVDTSGIFQFESRVITHDNRTLSQFYPLQIEVESAEAVSPSG